MNIFRTIFYQLKQQKKTNALIWNRIKVPKPISIRRSVVCP